MTSLNRQTYGSVDQQQPVYLADERSRVYAVMNDVSLTANNEISQEQQIVYYNHPANYQQINNPQSYVYPQHLSNNQIMNQHATTILNAQQHHQQQLLASSYIPSTLVQQPMKYSNMNQQQALLPLYEPSGNGTAMPVLPIPMINPTVPSTPILVQSKRGRNDTSGLSESNAPSRHQYPQTTRVFNSSSTPNKRHRGINQQRYDDRNAQHQPGQGTQNYHGTRDKIDPGENQQQPSLAACRYATSRFPFSPFSVIFAQDVREKVVVDDLIKHALNSFNFELKTVAYRRGRTETKDCRILIFVENSDSFSFLYEKSNWPNMLAGCEFTTKSPSIPPQLALVLPYVSLQMDWDDFVQESKDKYPGIVEIIRLKNKAQQPVRAVKLEFLSSKLRNELLEAGEISVLHMKLKVVEYYSQANVLICSNCYGIGHFRKNCPQKEEATCRTCGEKCANLKEHQCTGISKCIHCGGPHISNDTKCKVVKDYRAALTRNLLAKVVATNEEDDNSRRLQTNLPIYTSTIDRLPYATVTQIRPPNQNDDLVKKLDNILAKVQEESMATRQSLVEIKEEMRIRYEETKQQIDTLENKVKTIEKNFEDSFMPMFTIMQNICTSFLEPQGAQGPNWKSYWQEQIKSLAEFRLSRLKSI